MPSDAPFSNRYSYRPEPEITIREDAPEALRVTVVESVRSLAWPAHSLRDLTCRVLRVRPVTSNWDEDIWNEAERNIYNCDWFKVYDIIEAIYLSLCKDYRPRRSREDDALFFGTEINRCFIEEGIGWRLGEDGEIVSRGSKDFEVCLEDAKTALEESGRPTASGEIREALRALSLRPEPNLRGAVFHAMGALECVARDIAGDQKATLGDVIKKNSKLLPKPLDRACEQIWGYTSNTSRHVTEGSDPGREEAELVVWLAAAMTTYLTRVMRHS